MKTKKKLLGIFLPLLAGVTIVGTGFSLFYFLGENSTASLSINAEVKAYAELGQLTVVAKGEDDSAITTPSPLTSLTLKVDSSSDTGLTLWSGTDEVKDIDLTYALDTDATQADLFNKHPQVTMEVSVPSAFSTYFTLGLTNDDNSSPDPGLGTGTGEDPTVYTYVYDDTDFVTPSLPVSSPIEIDMPDLDFSWKSEPQTKADYETMISALEPDVSAPTLTITYTLQWANN